MHWLATTASVSPFIGLLGTVLGIIRAFHGSGQDGQHQPAAVGPGIAQALIATAVGLFAAIPGGACSITSLATASAKSAPAWTISRWSF